MKRSNAQYLIMIAIVAVGLVGIAFYSCEKEEIRPNEYTPIHDPVELEQNSENTIKMDDVLFCGEVTEQAIIDNSGKVAGKAFAYNDAKFFYLELISQKGYKMRGVQMELVLDLAKIPLDEKGNPDFNAFRFKLSETDDKPRRVIKLPIELLRGNTLVTATAEFVKVRDGDQAKIERVWVDGKSYGTTMPGRVFNYTKGVCLTDQADQDLADE